MKTYLVQWSIDIEAETPREAAEKAREIQLDPESIATVFRVMDFESDKFGVRMIYDESFDLEESDDQ